MREVRLQIAFALHWIQISVFRLECVGMFGQFSRRDSTYNNSQDNHKFRSYFMFIYVKKSSTSDSQTLVYNHFNFI